MRSGIHAEVRGEVAVRHGDAVIVLTMDVSLANEKETICLSRCGTTDCSCDAVFESVLNQVIDECNKVSYFKSYMTNFC